jgi:hypothetical protein
MRELPIVNELNRNIDDQTTRCWRWFDLHSAVKFWGGRKKI